MGQEDIMMRAFDGRVNQVVLTDGTRVQSYLEKNEVAFKQYEESQVLVVKMQDDTVMKVNKKEMVLIGGKDC